VFDIPGEEAQLAWSGFISRLTLLFIFIFIYYLLNWKIVISGTTDQVTKFDVCDARAGTVDSLPLAPALNLKLKLMHDPSTNNALAQEKNLSIYRKDPFFVDEREARKVSVTDCFGGVVRLRDHAVVRPSTGEQFAAIFDRSSRYSQFWEVREDHRSMPAADAAVAAAEAGDTVFTGLPSILLTVKNRVLSVARIEGTRDPKCWKEIYGCDIKALCNILVKARNDVVEKSGVDEVKVAMKLGDVVTRSQSHKRRRNDNADPDDDPADKAPSDIDIDEEVNENDEVEVEVEEEKFTCEYFDEQDELAMAVDNDDDYNDDDDGDDDNDKERSKRTNQWNDRRRLFGTVSHTALHGRSLRLSVAPRDFRHSLRSLVYMQREVGGASEIEKTTIAGAKLAAADGLASLTRLMPRLLLVRSRRVVMCRLVVFFINAFLFVCHNLNGNFFVTLNLCACLAARDVQLSLLLAPSGRLLLIVLFGCCLLRLLYLLGQVVDVAHELSARFFVSHQPHCGDDVRANPLTNQVELLFRRRSSRRRGPWHRLVAQRRGNRIQIQMRCGVLGLLVSLFAIVTGMRGIACGVVDGAGPRVETPRAAPAAFVESQRGVDEQHHVGAFFRLLREDVHETPIIMFFNKDMRDVVHVVLQQVHKLCRRSSRRRGPWHRLVAQRRGNRIQIQMRCGVLGLLVSLFAIVTGMRGIACGVVDGAGPRVETPRAAPAAFVESQRGVDEQHHVGAFFRLLREDVHETPIIMFFNKDMRDVVHVVLQQVHKLCSNISNSNELLRVVDLGNRTLPELRLVGGLMLVGGLAG
jgi:hypothetical protein